MLVEQLPQLFTDFNLTVSGKALAAGFEQYRWLAPVRSQSQNLNGRGNQPFNLSAIPGFAGLAIPLSPLASRVSSDCG